MRNEFTKAIKLQAWRRAAGRCEKCSTLLAGKQVAYDHINPDVFSGCNDLSNCQVLCLSCHAEKTYKHDIPTIAKSSRIMARHAGLRKERKILAWRNFSGEIVRKPKQR